jgi:hypothetical protein
VEELCKSHVGPGSVEGEDYEPEVVPNFVETHEALMTVNHSSTCTATVKVNVIAL